MATEKTVDRLQEAADLLAMVEEILASGMSARPSVSGGMKITVRNAREAVIRSYVEVRRDQAESKPIPAPQHLEPTPARTDAPHHTSQPPSFLTSGVGVTTTVTTESAAAQKRDEQSDREAQERIALRRRDLRASLEKLVDRNG